MAGPAPHRPFPDDASSVVLAERGRKRIVEHLRGAGALSAAAAIDLRPEGRSTQAALRSLEERGIVRRSHGKYWLDETMMDYRGKRRRTAMGMTARAVGAAGLAAMAVAAAWKWAASRRG